MLGDVIQPQRLGGLTQWRLSSKLRQCLMALWMPPLALRRLQDLMRKRRRKHFSALTRRQSHLATLWR